MIIHILHLPKILIIIFRIVGSIDDTYHGILIQVHTIRFFRERGREEPT